MTQVKTYKELITLDDERADILRKVTTPIDFQGDWKESVIGTCARMERLIADNKAAGLAAPQIGVSKSIIGIRTNSLGKVRFMLNPVYDKVWRDRMQPGEEGCLSLPGVNVIVPRSTKIRVKYYTVNGRFQKDVFTEYEARIIQHEMDHLQGLLIDRFIK